MTYKQIANKLRVSEQTVYYWITGARTPTIDKAKKLAYILDFDWTRFYEERQ